MRKLVLLVFCLLGFVYVQANGTYMLGTNQLTNLLNAVQDENGDDFTIPSETGQSNWITNPGNDEVPLFDFVWGGEFNPSYRAGADDKYRAITAIHWGGKNHTQKADVAINLNQDNMAKLDQPELTDDDKSLLEHEDLGYLATVDFSGNNFREISFDGLGALTTVNLSENPALESLVITNCSALESVDITGCRLSFAAINSIKSSVPDGTLDYELQGEITQPLDVVDITGILAACGSNTAVDSWTDGTPASNTGNVYVFNRSYKNTDVILNLKNPDYSGITLQYTVHLGPAAMAAVNFTSSSDNCSISWSPAGVEIGDEVTITVTPLSSWYDFVSFTVDGSEVSLNENNQYVFTPEKNSYELAAAYKSFGGTGEGTSESPYVIETERQLNQVRNNLSGRYQLGTDIALTAEWEPINNFAGVLDGDSHVISGLYIDKADMDKVGLFGTAIGTEGKTVEIKNLGIIIPSGKSVKGHENVGALVGRFFYLSGPFNGSLSINNCFINGKIEASGSNAGAFVGYVEADATITNVYALGSVIADNNAGGIVGKHDYGMSTLNISKSCTVNTVGNNGSAGGIIGSKEAGSTIVAGCVVAGSAITVTYPTGKGRVIGYQRGNGDFVSSTLSNNLAWENLPVNDSEVTEGLADNKNGLNKSALELRTLSTYETGLSWDFDDIWTMGNGDYRLPVLKSFAAANQPGSYVSHLPIEATWKSDAASTGMADAANWNVLPVFPNDGMIVSYNEAKNYPAVPEDLTVASLELKAGAEIGNQQNLTVTGTTGVEYAVTSGRWSMLSVPFDAQSGDFYFNDEPEAGLKKFTPDNNEAGWTDITSVEEDLPAGTGFAYWIKTDNDTTFSVSGTSLSNSVTETLVFGNGDDLESDFALAGNPFLTSIDFDALVANNEGVIGSSYLVWTGSGFAGYQPEGAWGISTAGMDKYIAPLQSFIVEKGNGTASLQFDVETVQATGEGVLKPSSEVGNKLNITAENGIASVSAFVAERENGASSRKLFAAVSDVPDIYTLNGTTALGANIINSKDLTIPVGLNTDFEGEITLTLSGMDTYDAKVTLVDNLLEQEIDITGRDAYRYPFENSAAGKTEDRFAIRLAPKTVGIAKVADDRVIATRYYNLQGLEIVQPIKGQVYLLKEILESGAVSISKIIRQQ
jgi:hypothetical protein